MFVSSHTYFQAFVLVSTAYSQTVEIGKLEERYYETPIRPEVIQKFVENVDADILDALTPKYFFFFVICNFQFYKFILFVFVFNSFLIRSISILSRAYRILDRHPNTYSFTKALLEQMAYDYNEKFPMAVARPPIITTAWKEPLPVSSCCCCYFC